MGASRHSFPWRTADYFEWNDLLLHHFLFDQSKRSAINRISATPDELAKAVGDRATDPDELTEAFLSTVRRELPEGRSFCFFCLKNAGWQPESRKKPHFFGMLWFTCLLAAGYPDQHGTFFDRFRAAVGTSDHLRLRDGGCLNRLWEDLARWSHQHPDCPELLLPPIDGYRNVIGRSYYLAFPNRGDRQVLEKVLAEAGLSGLEPPIVPAVDAVQRAKGRFSSEFRSELDRFLERFLRAGRDPKDCAFWQAIRSQAIRGSDLLVESPGVVGPISFLATWDDDEALLVRAACTSEVAIVDTLKKPLFMPLENLTHYLVNEDSGNPEPIVDKMLSGRIKLPQGLTSLVRQGVLAFREEIADEYRLAAGDEISGAEVALVRNERVAAFVEAFGGREEESRFDGWSEIVGCRVHQVPELPPELDGVYQLLYSTRAPRPRLVSVLRASGGYLWFPGLKPEIRAPGAEEIEISFDAGNAWFPCERTSQDGDWSLAAARSVTPPFPLHVKATYSTELEGRKVRRERTAKSEFVAYTTGFDYKPVMSGRYWRESCVPEQLDQRGKIAVPLDITCRLEAKSADLLEIDPTLRYLGPGLGEISEQRCRNHDWLATGPKKTPRHLVFVGDLNNPILPDGGESPDKGDQRSWSRTFTSRRTRITVRIDGDYLSPEQEPRLQHVLAFYKRRARRQLKVGEYRRCSPSRLASWVPDQTAPCRVAELTPAVVEAVAAFGLARSGFTLKEFQALMGHLTGRRDYLLWRQLIRSWEECGLVDILKRQDQSRTIVVPRPPRFVMVRRGPAVDATLIGLASRDAESAIEGLADALSLSLERVHPANEFQTPLLRLVETDAKDVDRLSNEIGLPSPEWLHWPDTDNSPKHLRVSNYSRGLSHGKPSRAYLFDALWDWERMVFERKPTRARELVEVERRWHPQRCSIYVILLDEEEMLWCYLRSWALLRAAELREKPPFEMSGNGMVHASGLYPIHLPLPFGRLCAVSGAGLPGPVLDPTGRVARYRYPFGKRFQPLVRSLIPKQWILQTPRGH